jgi:parvulin-like peptidyl-prolyl isomerase
MIRLQARLVSKLTDRRSVLPLLAAAFLVGGAGCGGEKAADDPVLARVGDREIRASYYQERLASLKQDELPKNESGEPVDTATIEGKEKFLEALINKELMQLKAEDLGYAKDETIERARRSFEQKYALAALQNAIDEEAGTTVGHDEFEHFYERLGEKRKFDYLITNFRDEAAAARERIVAGEKWDDVAAEFHAGSPPRNGTWQLSVSWGQYGDLFQEGAFSLEKNEVSQPIETDVGYWLLRPIEITKNDSPDVDEVRAEVILNIRRRKIAAARTQLLKEVREKYNFNINEDAMWICYQGLPEHEPYFAPGTREPVPTDQLEPLNIDPSDLGLTLYSYDSVDGPVVVTIRDYKELFDRMNVFERPKREQMFRGFIHRTVSEAQKGLLIREALARGYADDPEVKKEVQEKLYEMMVTKLHNDVVKVDRTTWEEAEAFWADHASEYAVPEGRHGRVVACNDLATAETAYNELVEGRPFAEVLDEYGTVEKNKERGGVLEPPIRDRNETEFAGALFDADIGDIVGPLSWGEKYVVAIVDSIAPAHQPELAEKNDDVAKRVEAQKRDELLRGLLAEWREEYGVTIVEENLAALPSWEELQSST